LGAQEWKNAVMQPPDQNTGSDFGRDRREAVFLSAFKDQSETWLMSTIDAVDGSSTGT
jgi:hypothetical protein